MAEPTIPERLRRLHHLYLADATAEHTDGDDVDPDTAWLRRTLERCIDTEVQALQAAAAELYRTHEPHRRIGAALLDLSNAADSQVRLRLKQDAYRAAEKSGAIVPKSQLIEQRRFIRGQVTNAEHRAQHAIRDVLNVLQIPKETN